MKYSELDTPTLLIDREVLIDNLNDMQKYANKNHVALRPHAKTHKMPYIAKMQCDIGAVGIAVAKVGEAEIMAANGIHDIFIANQIVGDQKLQRILKLSESSTISFGIDSPCHIEAIEKVFAPSSRIAQVLIEIEVGENRSGVIEESDFIVLLSVLKASPHVHLKGLFSHDGNSYNADDLATCHQISVAAQKRTLHFSELCIEAGFKLEIISIGSTPPLINNSEILEGITEIRPGTYALMDASQSNTIGTLSRCAATVLSTVTSKPTPTRVILDVGAKGLTKEERNVGICTTLGKGTLMDYPNIYISSLFDEHAIIYDQAFREQINIGDKVRIIPVHICPVCNLYDSAVLISNEEVIDEISILCRGKMK